MLNLQLKNVDNKKMLYEHFRNVQWIFEKMIKNIKILNQ